jgi:hypothetical protein
MQIGNEIRTAHRACCALTRGVGSVTSRGRTRNGCCRRLRRVATVIRQRHLATIGARRGYLRAVKPRLKMAALIPIEGFHVVRRGRVYSSSVVTGSEATTTTVLMIDSSRHAVKPSCRDVLAFVSRSSTDSVKQVA